MARGPERFGRGEDEGDISRLAWGSLVGRTFLSVAAARIGPGRTGMSDRYQPKKATLLVAECLRDKRKRRANPESSGSSLSFTKPSHGGQHDIGGERELKRGDELCRIETGRSRGDGWSQAARESSRKGSLGCNPVALAI